MGNEPKFMLEGMQEERNKISSEQDSKEQSRDMKDFPELLEKTLPSTTRLENKIVQGTVLSVDRDYVVVSIGFKNDGKIPISEFEDEIPSTGDEIPVYVFHLENRQAECVVSYSKVKKNMAWNDLNERFKEKQPIEGVVIGSVKGGYTVDIKGLYAFLPGSQLDYNLVTDGNIIGKTYSFQILKIDAPRINIIVSQKRINQSEQEDKRNQLLNSIEEGDIVEGRVKNLTSYGAFIDLNGIDGLLHITDISWHRISHPQDVLKLDSKIKTKVIKLNKENGRINLGLKQLTQDPWQDVDKKYHEGDVIESLILNVTDYGAFVKLEDNIEGLIHVSEVDWHSNDIVAKEVFHVGEKIKAVILEVNKEKKRIALGIKQLTPNPWIAFSQKHKKMDTLNGKIIKILDQGLIIHLVDDNITGFSDIHNITGTDKEGEKIDLHERFQVGQDLKVKLLNVIPEKEKIILAIRESSSTSDIKDIKIGQTLTCAVTKTTKQGVYVMTNNNQYTGFISVGHLSANRLDRNPEKFAINDKIDANVIGFGYLADKQILLSIKNLEVVQKKKIIAEFGSATSGARLGDILGMALQQKALKVQQKEAKEEKPKTSKAKDDAKKSVAQPQDQEDEMKKPAASKDRKKISTKAKKTDAKNVEIKEKVSKSPKPTNTAEETVKKSSSKSADKSDDNASANAKKGTKKS